MKEKKKREKRFYCDWCDRYDRRITNSILTITLLATVFAGIFFMINFQRMMLEKEEYKDYYPEQKYECLIKQAEYMGSFYSNIISADSTEECVTETLTIESGREYAPNPTVTISISKDGISKKLNYSSKEEYIKATRNCIRFPEIVLGVVIMIIVFVGILYIISSIRTILYNISLKNKEKKSKGQ